MPRACSRAGTLPCRNLAAVRALVTGGLGFVGHHLVAHLREHGDDVVVLDRRGEGGVDITDAAGIHEAVARAAPDALYHLAGWADVGGSWQHPVEAFRANAEGTLNVLLACAASGVQRTLSVGSADVYGVVTEAELPLTEESPLRPASPYAASKVAADFLALQAHLGQGLGVIRVRAFNHLGPGQTDRFVAAALAARIAVNERDGGDTVRVGDLSARRDFTDVRDVVRAYRLLAELGAPGEVYNVCSGVDLAVQELADRMLALAARPMRVETDPSLLRPVEIPVLRGDSTKLREATGWEPEIPIDQTLTDLLDDQRSRVAAG
jgi:GDP-4-dehydro-6-deoxy-D-mannose reductase